MAATSSPICCRPASGRSRAPTPGACRPALNYPYRIDGQRVSFCVSDAPSSRGATYWARVVSTGEYTAEPALIQSMQSAQSINFSAADRVIIR